MIVLLAYLAAALLTSGAAFHWFTTYGDFDKSDPTDVLVCGITSGCVGLFCPIAIPIGLLGYAGYRISAYLSPQSP